MLSMKTSFRSALQILPTLLCPQVRKEEGAGRITKETKKEGAGENYKGEEGEEEGEQEEERRRGGGKERGGQGEKIRK